VILEDVNPARLRYQIQDGQPVEALYEKSWQRGIVTHLPGYTRYEIRMLDSGKEFSANAHDVRPYYHEGDAVEVWVGDNWQSGIKVLESTPNFPNADSPTPVFSSQDLVVELNRKRTSINSSQVRWYNASSPRNLESE